jgi:hypothetical protein
VVSFSGTEAAGRTGIHAHFAHAHIVIPTSGRGVFSYDGLVTEAVPGVIIAQHGGTIHDQFSYSYAADGAPPPLSVDPMPQATAQSFGFLELFVPKSFANVEIIPPEAVSEADQNTAWDHPYHAAGADFFVQDAGDGDAAYRPVANRQDLQARDAGTGRPSGGLVATWIVRSATAGAAGPEVSIETPGETGGIDILFMANGSATFPRDGGEPVRLEAGDTLTCNQGLVGDPIDVSPDMRLVKFFIAARAQQLRERTAEEIARLEALGSDIITRREVRLKGDTRGVNFLRDR